MAADPGRRRDCEESCGPRPPLADENAYQGWRTCVDNCMQEPSNAPEPTPSCPDGRPARRRGGTGQGSQDWVCYDDLPDDFDRNLPQKEQTSTVPRASYNAAPVDFSKFLTRGPGEQAALQGISDLARLISGMGANLYGVGMPAYAAAINYYRALLGPSKGAATQAIAPQGELISEVYRGAERGIEAGPRGGHQDMAKADLARSKAGQIGALIPQAQQGAAAASAQLGLAGSQAGIGSQQASGNLLGGVVEAEQSNRLAGLSAFLQNKSLDLQRLLGLRGQDIQEMLGLKNIELGYANVDLGYAGLDQQSAALAQANQQFQMSFGLQQQQFDWYRQFQNMQLEQQQRQSSGNKWGSLLGTMLGIGGKAIPTKMVTLFAFRALGVMNG